jgi:DNA-directed RNA polymerase specialized sigma24 family protein
LSWFATIKIVAALELFSMKRKEYKNTFDPSREECTIILKRLRGGDNTAFEVIYTLYFEAVRMSAQKYVTEQDATDIALSTFLKLWEHRKKFKFINNPGKRKEIVQLLFNGYKIDEVADKLNITKETAQNYKSQALSLMRQKFHEIKDT